MDTFYLSKDIFGKLADISNAKVVQSSNEDDVICEYVQDKKASIEFFNGTVYDGPIVGGKLHGKGLLRFSDKSTFQGQFEYNQILGPGEIHYSELEGYKGDFKGFARHGSGSYWHNGLKMKYEGQWENDLIHGKGQLEVKDKWAYTGDFLKNKKHGKGVLCFASGAKYEGEFLEDLKHGQGSMFWQDPQEVYHGEWDQGRLEGFGVYIYQNNFTENKHIRNHFRGFFQKGAREGLGVHFYSDGSVYVGEWKQNMKHGQAVFLDDFGEKFLMSFDSNRRIHEARVRNSLVASKRLGFVLDLRECLARTKTEKKDVVNFILNFKRTFKGLFQMGMEEFLEKTEESKKLTVKGVLCLMQKLKVFNRKSGTTMMEWIARRSEHNFIFTGYSKENIEVRYLESVRLGI